MPESRSACRAADPAAGRVGRHPRRGPAYRLGTVGQVRWSAPRSAGGSTGTSGVDGSACVVDRDTRLATRAASSAAREAWSGSDCAVAASACRRHQRPRRVGRPAGAVADQTGALGHRTGRLAVGLGSRSGLGVSSTGTGRFTSIAPSSDTVWPSPP